VPTQNLNHRRRSLLTLFCGLPAIILVRGAHATSEARRPAVVASEDTLAPGDLKQAIHKALQGQSWQPSDAVKLDVPQMAENGAIVPISVESLLPNTRRILIFAERNPGPLLAEFNLKPVSDAWVSLRVKLNDNGPVLAIAESSGRYYGAQTYVRVMVGGCG
jgi:sulfur-oxidizing protein SoxY